MMDYREENLGALPYVAARKRGTQFQEAFEKPACAQALFYLLLAHGKEE